MPNEIGELFEEPGEVRGLWRIPNFLSLPEEVDKVFQSPKFIFFDSCWCLEICPNGETKDESFGCVGVYLVKLDCGCSKKVSFTFGVKNFEGQIEYLRIGDVNFPPESQGFGYDKFLQRFELHVRKTELLPSDSLTITYTVKNKNEGYFEGSLFGRLWNMSLKLKNMLSTGKRTDVTLKLKCGNISAHRMILESRSPVFERMFGVDMLESVTGEVTIEDSTVDAFRVALSYVYGGEPTGLTSKNVTEVYRVAHKYEMDELRKLCARVMQETLSTDTVFDVIALADLYEDRALKECAKKYFAKNKTEIIETEKWITFKRDNPIIGFEIMESIIKGDS